VGLLVACAVATGYTYADHAPLIPLLTASLQVTPFEAGLFSTALFGTYLVGTLVTTGLPDRYGAKAIVGAGLVFAEAGSITLALAPTYTVALAGKVLEGVATSLTFAAGNRYIAGLYGPRRSHFAVGLYGAGFPAGSACALALMPRVATGFGDWRPAFGVEAVAIAVVGVAWLAAPSVVRVPRRGSMRDALRCQNCWWTGLQHAGFGVAVAAGTWITVFLLQEFDLPLSASGLLGSVLLSITTCARPLGGLLVARRWIQTRQAMALANCLLIIGLAALLIPSRPLAIALLGIVVLGLGAGLPFASVFNTAAASLRTAPAAAQGLPTMMGSLVILIAAPAMGYAVQAVGFSAAWSFVLIIALGALLATRVVRGEEELSDPPPADLVTTMSTEASPRGGGVLDRTAVGRDTRA
jgi:nitrate/nitrite transporter NarK